MGINHRFARCDPTIAATLPIGGRSGTVITARSGS